MSTTELEPYETPDVPLRREDAKHVTIATPMPNPLGQRIVPTLREALSWYLDVETGARLRLRKAGFDGLRLPLYVLRSWLFAPHGMWRVAAWWWGAFGVERHRVAYATALRNGDHVRQDEFGEKGARAVWARGIMTGLVLLSMAGGGWWMWHAHRLWSLLGGGMLLTVLGLFGASSVGRRVRTDFVPKGDIRLRDPNVYVAALQPLCPKDSCAAVVGVPHRDGDAWRVRVRVPVGLKAAKVVQERAIVAQGLAVAEDRVSVDTLQLEAADLIELIVSDHHPMTVTMAASPVEDADRTDVWQGVPIGMSAAGLVVLSMDESHALVAGATGTGKTHITRNILNGGLLDPLCEPIVWDFKAAGDFAPYRKVITVNRGSDDRNVKAFAEWMTWLRTDVARRGEAMDALVDSEETDDPKLTRWAAHRLGLRLLLVVVDEVQVPLGWGGDLGKQIAADLLFVARMGRAAGVRLILSTQRPDSTALEPALRAQLPARICLRVDNPASSLAALGVRADAGWEADSLPSEPKGAAIALGPGILPGATRFRAFESGIPEARRVVSRVEAFRSVQTSSVNRPELHLVQDAPRPVLPEVLRVALSAWPNPGKDAHSDILAGGIGWDRGDLVAAMKREGVPHEPVHQPRTDGQRTTQRGFRLADVEAAARRYGWS